MRVGRLSLSMKPSDELHPSARKSNASFSAEFRQRTRNFAIRVLKLGDSLPTPLSAQVVGRQSVRSATSVAANYRAACRARSDREFAAKLHIALEEADESELWLELLEDAEVVQPNRLQSLHTECGEIVAILATSERTARQRNQKAGLKPS